MAQRFYELAFTPAVQAEQEKHGSRRQYDRMEHNPDFQNALGPDEQHFLSLRDSFYMASVSETGWPYVQHRGGPPGFIHVLRPTLLGFADLRGNKQYISLGNLTHDPRVALFFMDYPSQTRLKILGRAEVHEHDTASIDLLQRLRTSVSGAVAEPKGNIERAILIHVEGFDWNCPQHITPRYTLAELEPHIAPLRRRIADLESQLAAATIKP
jgi:predicted pyridoxine 5'-phosphate oxidase superfamily flavin-nucleotide-binding protein